LSQIINSEQETEYERRIRIGKKQGIVLREFYQTSSKEENDKLLFRSDRLRKESDIRFKQENDLTWYQRAQKKLIEKKTREYESYQLRKAIFNTFEDWERKGLESYDNQGIN
jgi:hypothetical protein